MALFKLWIRPCERCHRRGGGPRFPLIYARQIVPATWNAEYSRRRKRQSHSQPRPLVQLEERRKLSKQPYADLSYKWAAGGFLSTAEDLVRFGSALLEPGFLKQETLEMIFSPQKTTSGEKTKYGLGWEIHDAGDGEPVRRFEHSGGATGSSSFLIIYPDQKVVIAWLLNSDDFRDWPLRKVAAPFFPIGQ